MTKKLHKKSKIKKTTTVSKVSKKKFLEAKKSSKIKISSHSNKEDEDAQLKEFESEDLGDSIRLSDAGQKIVRKSKPTSLLLDPFLIDMLRTKAASRGLGYQTMLKMIVRENIHRY